MGNKTATVLSLSDIHKTYTSGPAEVEVLRGITFSVHSGESLALMGPSGSGKSTLLHLIGTLDRPTSGTISFDGRSPHELPEPELAVFRNRRVGFVFQDHHLLPQYSVLENVLLPALAVTGATGSTERARQLVDRVGLTHRIDHRPSELSGGERQRAAVARALVNNPDLLLCDEPTGNLDAGSAAAVATLLLELHRSENTILIVATHSPDLATGLTRRMRLAEGLCSEI